LLVPIRMLFAAFMRDQPCIPLLFQNGLSFLDPRWQLNRDKMIIDFDGKCHAVYLAIIAILKRNVLCSVRSQRVLQFSKYPLDWFV
jgi:hypothetical protein